MRIAVLGTGMMGGPMARRLCDAGHAVQVWNRTRAKAEPLAEQGATVHDTARGAVAGAELVVSMLADGPTTEAVLFGAADGVAAAMAPGALLVDMASIRPAEARDHAARLRALGIAHVDAPVSGGTIGAQAGTLAIMAGGDEAEVARARAALPALGRWTLVGPSGTGQLAKLANQVIVGVTIGAVAEALLLCERGGADPARVRQALSGGFADSRILQVHGERMVTRDFAPRARMTVQLKDMRNALAAAGELGFDAPITTRFESLFGDAVAHGLADLDHSGLFVELARRNGIE
jgi:3-hydroxyisobutyrate dehydrogenase-like beta-hydroxyacid dehydrogenase